MSNPGETYPQKLQRWLDENRAELKELQRQRAIADAAVSNSLCNLLNLRRCAYGEGIELS